jgi:predicted secreted Zn-dependent protease
MLKHQKMRILFIFIWVAIVLPLKADVNESIEYTYYIANADPSQSLLSILNSSTPIRIDGKLFHGYTYWHLKWYFRWSEKPDGSCKVSSVMTELTCNIQLPKLLGATSKQRDQFDKYLSALRAHELGHCQIGNRAAATIDRKILSLPEMSNCNDLGVAGNNIGNQTLREYKEKAKQYDEKTEYGRSQGAWLDR